MEIAETLQHQFDSETRRKGEEYYEDGTVEIIRTNNQRLVAHVQGNQRYRVEILRDAGKGYRYTCTCPFYADRQQNCKHIWATVLHAEDNDELPGQDDLEAEAPRRSVSREPATPGWKKTLATLRKLSDLSRPNETVSAIWPADRKMVYLIDVPLTVFENQGLQVELMTQRLRAGRWEAPKQMRLEQDIWLANPDPEDQLIAHLLIGAREEWEYGYGGQRRFVIAEKAYNTTLRAMVRTGRCRVKRESDDSELPVIGWDDGEPWHFVLKCRRIDDGKFEIVPMLARGETTMPLSAPSLILRGGLIVTDNVIARFEHYGAFDLAAGLRDGTKVVFTRNQAEDFLKELSAFPRLPPIELPDSLEYQQIVAPPRPHLTIRSHQGRDGVQKLLGSVYFEYGTQRVLATDNASLIYRPDSRQLLIRDRQFEARAMARLAQVGFKSEWIFDIGEQQYALPSTKLSAAVTDLSAGGWTVEAEGKLYRRSGDFKVEVRSGIDWFELSATVDFGDARATLPQLLAAMRKGESTVVLDDGSVGLLPEEWLKKYAVLAGVGEEENGQIRFQNSQIGFLDALLASMPEVKVDEAFTRAREQLQKFSGIESIDASAGFVGELRPYQRDGLGWLAFLEKFSFGGCLADDMGLGKTIQVLAMLERRREAQLGTSLVVVPRSLIFNWMQEAAKFTPGLKVLDQSGVERKREHAHFAEYDLILTTYGTLRRDATYFKDFLFDYVILDEAQAVKNSASESAKAVRLLRGKHRLAMSGTPIENHLGELWSLFDFLNPGMLGTASLFKNMSETALSGDAEGRRMLAHALRPFILRRTKEQVARDLPEKLEQTLFCELDTAQRKLYDELRVHYRQTLLGTIAEQGMGRAKIQILEALLRLRQAACHPGLVDRTRTAEPSAKLEVLMEHLREVIDEGHKVLVFSQFTSFLAILRERLDQAQMVHEYLDGKTRDRQARVERFQNDQACKLFLVSLKAGGTGLNLTAADYVFLLDPWWNPAVESQAIDRAHRIGQTRRVFAYRLIAKDTVEEKVLLLQKSKKDLAEAIITADNSLIGKLQKEDLEMLLA